MIVRYFVLLVGALEVFMPRRIVDFWMNLAVPDGDEVEVRPWVYTVARLEGVILVVWALYRLQGKTGSRETNLPTGEVSASDDAGISGASSQPSVEQSQHSENGQDNDLAETASTPSTSSELTITPGTRKFTLASTLYHATDNLTVSEIVELFDGTPNEMTNSNVSAALYTMHQDGIVHRQKRGDNGSYEYWLTAAAIDVLESVDEPLKPDPFAE